MNDFAHVLQPDAVQRMERIAEDVRTKSRGEIAIVTLPDIGTRDVEQVATQIGRQWKVGKAGTPGDPTRNAGAVILIVPKETSKDGRGHCFVATGRATRHDSTAPVDQLLRVGDTTVVVSGAALLVTRSSGGPF